MSREFWFLDLDHLDALPDRAEQVGLLSEKLGKPTSLNISKDYSLAGIGTPRYWFSRWCSDDGVHTRAYEAGHRYLEDYLPDILAKTNDGVDLKIKPGVREIVGNIVIAYRASEYKGKGAGRKPHNLIRRLQRDGYTVRQVFAEVEETDTSTGAVAEGSLPL